MEKVNVELQNCFGIQRMEHEFDFHGERVITLYARNGLMKTSFTKTFQKIQAGKRDEIKDVIFEQDGVCNVKVDGRDIAKEDVFVIRSLDSSYESDISPLLIDDSIKRSLKETLKARETFLKKMADVSGVKIKKTVDGKVVYDLEEQIIESFGFTEKSILLNLDRLRSMSAAVPCGNIKYDTIFDPTVLKKILNPDFQQEVRDFVVACDRIYSGFPYLEKGGLTFPKLKDMAKALKKDGFFVRNNQILLAGTEIVPDMTTLENHIASIQDAIQNTPELRKIEGLLGDTIKGIAFKDVIEMNPWIVGYLEISQLPVLKQALWLSYIADYRPLLDDLYNKYSILAATIANASTTNTPWEKALDIFDNRFSVPFRMRIANLNGAIIGESVPKVEFVFQRGMEEKILDRATLDDIDTLSQGEKRALYLLNIIFDIEKLKTESREKLIIVDDIADSFDYKNKYAIIEYLYEMAHEENFYLLILSHNFDFYRAVSSRVGVHWKNHLMANTDGSSVRISEDQYQKQPFKLWKKNLTKKNVIALIPFVRNLVEYGKDENNPNAKSDYLFLTSLLHEKEDTHEITFEQLRVVYEKYLDKHSFEPEVPLSGKVIEVIYEVCNDINELDSSLENKIVLAIGIRHKAEEFMREEIINCPNVITWKYGRHSYSGRGEDFILALGGMKKQTRQLLNVYKEIGSDEKVQVMCEVNIMTPENIHLNSFMYEPLLDMDIVELLELYRRVKNL